jgi:hypothetical protein
MSRTSLIADQKEFAARPELIVDVVIAVVGGSMITRRTAPWPMKFGK